MYSGFSSLPNSWVELPSCTEMASSALLVLASTDLGPAVVKTPRAIGGAVVRLLQGNLPADWLSSDGAPLRVEHLG